jgi:hypothetical protein
MLDIDMHHSECLENTAARSLNHTTTTPVFKRSNATTLRHHIDLAVPRMDEAAACRDRGTGRDQEGSEARGAPGSFCANGSQDDEANHRQHERPEDVEPRFASLIGVVHNTQEDEETEEAGRDRERICDHHAVSETLKAQ